MFDWVQNTHLEKKLFKVLKFLNPLIKFITLLKEIKKCPERQISWKLERTFQFCDQICPNPWFWVNIINSKYYIHNLHVRFAISAIIKIKAHFSLGTQFCKFIILGQGHQFQLIYSLLACLICSECQIS